MEQRRPHALERGAAIIRLIAAVTAIPLLAIYQKDNFLVLTILIAGLALFSVVAALAARRFPSSTVAANVGWPVALGVTVAIVAISGGSNSPLWVLMVFPMIGAVSRFKGGVSAAALAVIVISAAVIAALTPGAGAGQNVLMVFSLAVLGLAMWMVGERDVRLHREVVLDPLTELFNRHHLSGRLAELDITLERAGGMVAVITADLDFFKLVNDEYGHARGDAVLRDVAYMLRENIRENDVAFRAGGEEFVLILPGAEQKTAHAIAERVRQAVEQGRPGDLHVTISCGVASARAADGIDMNGLMISADRALYVAKRGGRNRVCDAEASFKEASLQVA